MAEHPIQGLMNVTMEKIHQMVASNTGFQGELWLCLRRHRL